MKNCGDTAMPKIGIFWFYKDTVLGRAVPLEEGMENVPGIIDSPDSHADYWENNPSFVAILPELSGVDYDTIPRGRVLFSKVDGRAIVYMDPALNSQRIKRLIAGFFGLHHARVAWRKDLHYTTDRKTINSFFS